MLPGKEKVMLTQVALVTPASLFTQAPALPSDTAVDVTEIADTYPRWAALRQDVFIASDVYERLVEWSDEETDRTGYELTIEDRLATLMYQGQEAARQLSFGEQACKFQAEYYDSQKRGNPRRALLQAVRTPYSTLIDFA